MSRLMHAVVAVLAASCLLAGCQPTSPLPSPGTMEPTSPSGAPTPTFRCTPEAGGEESPCTQAQYDEMKAKDALYAEAEAVYRKLFAENIRISRAGGVSEPTDVIAETTTGAFREDVMAIFEGLAERGLRARGSDPVVIVARAPGVSKEGSIVALSACVDARGWAFYRGDERVSEGKAAADLLYFNRVEDDALKIIGADGELVSSCPS